jgi:amino-acid N-acetyltransferase
VNITRQPPDDTVKAILISAQLPTGDITPNRMENFFGVWSGATLEGVVGVEIYGTVALLRSLAVVALKRGCGLGTRLLAHAEQHAIEKGVRTVFLLTNTAEAYFNKRGYSVISRESAPEAIRNTAEFTSVCPASSTLMVKYLR